MCWNENKTPFLVCNRLQLLTHRSSVDSGHVRSTCRGSHLQCRDYPWPRFAACQRERAGTIWTSWLETLSRHRVNGIVIGHQHGVVLYTATLSFHCKWNTWQCWPDVRWEGQSNPSPLVVCVRHQQPLQSVGGTVWAGGQTVSDHRLPGESQVQRVLQLYSYRDKREGKLSTN